MVPQYLSQKVLLSYATTHSHFLVSQNVKIQSATEQPRKIDSNRILLTTWENNNFFKKNNKYFIPITYKKVF